MLMKLKLWKLRIHAAWTMLTDKEFYRKMRAYKKLDKYTGLIQLLSRGSIHVNDINVEDLYREQLGSNRLYKANLTFFTYDQEACFDLRRLCLSIPIGYFNGKEIEELENLELCVK